MGRNIEGCIEWIKTNAEALNIEIVKIENNKITVKCKECNAIKTCLIESLYGNYIGKIKSIHGDSCSKYYNNIIRNELGDTYLRKFRDHYRYAKERCCNPNSKDYKRYKGKMKYKDYVDYFLDCYEVYKKSLIEYGYDAKLTIDRKDGHKGYEHGNVRFVPIKVNLQNKDIVIPVMAVNIKTHKILTAVSLYELCTKYFDENKHSAIYDSIQENKLYKNEWKMFYTIKTQSTIETT